MVCLTEENILAMSFSVWNPVFLLVLMLAFLILAFIGAREIATFIKERRENNKMRPLKIN